MIEDDLKKQNKNTFQFFTIAVGIVLILKGLGFTEISWEVLIGLILVAAASLYFARK
ncbi:Uncharacterised protein [uncultured archaeon]|nr:Uncharacterised protein [uncultured archaeon]